GRRVVGEVAVGSVGGTLRRRQHGFVPGVRRGVVLHRTGHERDRWHGDALSAEPNLEHRADGTTVWPVGEVVDTPALSFNRVSMVFPDGTQALRETTFDVREGEFV